MNRARTSRLVKGTLAGILAFVPLYGCNREAGPPQPDAQANATQSLLTEIGQLKQRNKELEEKGYDPENPVYVELRKQKCKLETKINYQELRLAELTSDKSGLLVQVYKLSHPDEEQAWKKDKVESERKLQRLYANSSINGNYPVEAIEQLMDEAKIPYDKKRFEEEAGKFSPEARQGFFLAFLDEKQLHASYDSGKKGRYDEFFRNGITDKEKNRILNDLGIRGNDLNQKHSALSLAVFEVYETNIPRLIQ